MYFMMLGPMTFIMLAMLEKSFILGKNMAFSPTKELLLIYSL
jgi:hypothetical protein